MTDEERKAHRVAVAEAKLKCNWDETTKKLKKKDDSDLNQYSSCIRSPTIRDCFEVMAKLEKRIEELETEQKKNELFKKWVKGIFNELKNIGKEKF